MTSELTSFLENFETKKYSYDKCSSLRSMMSRYMGANRFLFILFISFFICAVCSISFSYILNGFEYENIFNNMLGFTFWFFSLFSFLMILISYGNNADIGREINKQFHVKFHWYSLPFGLALKLKSNKDFIDFLTESNKKENELEAELKNIYASFYKSNQLNFNKVGYSKLNNNLRNVYLFLFNQNIQIFEKLEKENG